VRLDLVELELYRPEYSRREGSECVKGVIYPITDLAQCRLLNMIGKGSGTQRLTLLRRNGKHMKSEIPYFPAHKTHRDFFFRNFRKKNNECILVGFTLSQATKALRESRGIALLYFRPRH